MKHTHLTMDFLTTHNACHDGIDFAVRNKLIGFPLSRIDEVEGDLDGFVDWVRGVVDRGIEFEYDADGKMTKRIYPNGDVIQYEYDTDGHKIKRIYPDGDEVKYEYNTNGNKTKEIYLDGREYQWEYDSNGNVTKEILLNGYVYQYEYDLKGNMTKKILPNGGEIQWEYKYYDNGQLAEVVDYLKIPQF